MVKMKAAAYVGSTDGVFTFIWAKISHIAGSPVKTFLDRVRSCECPNRKHTPPAHATMLATRAYCCCCVNLVDMGLQTLWG